MQSRMIELGNADTSSMATDTPAAYAGTTRDTSNGTADASREGIALIRRPTIVNLGLVALQAVSAGFFMSGPGVQPDRLLCRGRGQRTRVGGRLREKERSEHRIALCERCVRVRVAGIARERLLQGAALGRHVSKHVTRHYFRPVQ